MINYYLYVFQFDIHTLDKKKVDLDGQQIITADNEVSGTLCIY